MSFKVQLRREIGRKSLTARSFRHQSDEAIINALKAKGTTMELSTEITKILFDYRPTFLQELCIESFWPRRFVAGDNHFINLLVRKGNF
jgi:hypothetical protein